MTQVTRATTDLQDVTASSTPGLDPRETTRRIVAALAADQGLQIRSAGPSRRTRSVGRFGWVLSMVLVGTVAIAALAGWRLVIIRSGSMSESAPLGSLLLVAPRDGDAIKVGDIIVMSRPDGTSITHAVTSIEQSGTSRLATTQGETNTSTDPVPYLLEGDTLTVRSVIPHLGRMASLMQTHWLGLLLVLAAVFVVLGDDGPEMKRPAHRFKPRRNVT